jgi:glycine betaine/proline transport system substrate-binding protein
VSVVTAPDYAQRCPNVSRLLSNLTFNAAQENQKMVPIMDHKTPNDVVRQWLHDHPEDLQRWLAGVTTFDGKDAAMTLSFTTTELDISGMAKLFLSIGYVCVKCC